MVPIDPIDLFSSVPFDPVSYYGHLVIGTVGLLAAVVALFAAKGRAVHIWAGRVFIGAILLVTTTALVLLATRFAPPLLVAGISAVYAVGTAWLALKPGRPNVKRAEYALTAIQTASLVVFLAIAIPNVVAGNIPPIALVVIAAIPLILLAGDWNFYRQPKRRRELRIRRHMARMIWALIIAIRAPLTELYADLSIPAPLLLFGPLVIAPALILALRPKARRVQISSG